MKLIIDTDFGDDIDDTFALAYLLKRVRNDIALVLSDFGDTRKRAELVADYLGRCGCIDLPVGIGVAQEYREPYQYKLARLAEERVRPVILEDGISEAVRIILESMEPVIFVALGPFTNLAEILKRCPQAGKTLRVIAMAGSVRKGYFNSPVPDREYNVMADIAACRAVFESCTQIKMTPLDTCGDIYLRDSAYRQLLECEEPITAELMKDFGKWLELGFVSATESTSCLYDVVAAYMAVEEDSLLQYETLPLVVDEEGYTRISREGYRVSCALKWAGKESFLEHLLEVFLR